MVRIREKPEVRREKILDAARDLFLEKGFERVSMDAIAKEASLSKGGLYHYFSSTTEILLALCARKSRRRLEEAKEWNGSSQGWKEILFRKLLEDNDERKIFAMFLEASRQREHLYKAFLTMCDEECEHFRRIAVEHGLGEEMIQKATSREFIAYMAMVSLGMSHPWIRDVLMEHPEFVLSPVYQFLGIEDEDRKRSTTVQGVLLERFESGERERSDAR